RAMLGYVPVVLKVGLAIAMGTLLFAGYRAAAAASFFQIRNVEIQGNSRASVEDVQILVKRQVGETGVWRADLDEISAQLERLPWIRTAVVSRVLPDGIRVRLKEREPSAVVRMTSGKFVWVDEDAVALGEMKPTDQMPAFFLRGWNEEEGEAARKENVDRISRFMTLLHEWSAAGLAERVSEVNLIDVRDVRAQLAGDDAQIELRLGSQDFLKRLRGALNVLDEHRQTPRGPFISYIDLTQGRRAIVGFRSGAHAISNRVVSTNSASSSAPADNKTEKNRASKRNDERNAEQRPRRVRAT
ncbi:MAG TPA: FtsQ-type POTRA domain-containing protein, partial [Pyrinomonadaceae bacterium]|nr:FtsQ-type POTRA domain-containing protein [Pyrinomonadaceae bacterium]